jgi:hypothetical protein
MDDIIHKYSPNVCNPGLRGVQALCRVTASHGWFYILQGNFRKLTVSIKLNKRSNNKKADTGFSLPGKQLKIELRRFK